MLSARFIRVMNDVKSDRFQIFSVSSSLLDQIFAMTKATDTLRSARTEVLRRGGNNRGPPMECLMTFGID